MQHAKWLAAMQVAVNFMPAAVNTLGPNAHKISGLQGCKCSANSIQHLEYSLQDLVTSQGARIVASQLQVEHYAQ
jgi:hypothetical protein